MTRIRSKLASRTAKISLGVLVLLVAARTALPFVVEDYVNDTLDSLDGYSGHVEDVDIHLWRGAYEIEQIEIVKTGAGVKAPLASIKELDLSIEWGALLDGAIVAEIDVIEPVLNFVAAKPKKKGDKPSLEQEPSDNWTDVVKDLVPFSINRFAIVGGEVHYRDFDAEPQVDIYVQKLNMIAHNLTNSKDLGGTLTATFNGDALAMGSGKLTFEGRVDPYASKPTFDTKLQLNDLALTQLNDYLRSYANIDVEKGTLSVDAEFAAADGSFDGYLKPFIEDLDVLRWSEESESLPNKLWQGLVEVVGEVLEDQSRDRIATKVPFKGNLENPGADVWVTLGNLLKNAFIEALRRGLEGSISFGTAKNSED